MSTENKGCNSIAEDFLPRVNKLPLHHYLPLLNFNVTDVIEQLISAQIQAGNDSGMCPAWPYAKIAYESESIHALLASEKGDANTEALADAFLAGLFTESTCDLELKQRHMQDRGHLSRVIQDERRGKVDGDQKEYGRTSRILIENIQRYSNEEDILNFGRKVLLTTLGKSLLGIDFNHQQLDMITEVMESRMEFLHYASVLKIPTKVLNLVPKFVQSRSHLYKIARYITEQAIESTDENMIKYYWNQQPNKTIQEKERLHAHTATILIAGHETTSSTTAFLLLELFNPENDQQKQELVQSIQGINFSSPDLFNQINSNQFLSNWVVETLRFYPALPIINRVSDKGESIFLYPQWSHRHDTNVWGDNPGQFNPKRFTDISKKTISKNLFTFGGGHRRCIGADMASYELKLLLAFIAQNYNVSHDYLKHPIQESSTLTKYPINTGKTALHKLN